MTTPDEARAAARANLTPARRAELAAIATGYRVKHPWQPPSTRRLQDDVFEAREDAAEKEQERRQ